MRLRLEAGRSLLFRVTFVVVVVVVVMELLLLNHACYHILTEEKCMSLFLISKSIIAYYEKHSNSIGQDIPTHMQFTQSHR
ncbi:MAG: hypothetical protein M3250_00215 [Thermoproteota archaeon]|nr:hypothetical protein [Thermoproteota archaeon]